MTCSLWLSLVSLLRIDALSLLGKRSSFISCPTVETVSIHFQFPLIFLSISFLLTFSDDCYTTQSEKKYFFSDPIMWQWSPPSTHTIRWSVTGLFLDINGLQVKKCESLCSYTILRVEENSKTPYLGIIPNKVGQNGNECKSWVGARPVQRNDIEFIKSKLIDKTLHGTCKAFPWIYREPLVQNCATNRYCLFSGLD